MSGSSRLWRDWQQMDLKRAFGFSPVSSATDRAEDQRVMRQYVRLRLAASGLRTADAEVTGSAEGLLNRYREQSRLLIDHRCGADQRIEEFLSAHFQDVEPDGGQWLPGRTLVVDRHGMARELSLPENGDVFESPYVRSHRVANGVLHNPRNDRRTTQGTFHVAEGGLPVPADKRAVPKRTFAELLRIGLNPPNDVCRLPFDSDASCIVSLLLRPLVSPGVPGFAHELRMETRFFAPGGLVSNLDFVESIFGNAGDPFLPENDAGLDVKGWSGHTGAVILAPHLERITKRQVGLPHVSKATERQKRDGMCWSDESDLYNDGKPFKATCRTTEGVIVTLISDNYYGYCKKEVKTQLSYAANLLGSAEEEHAGGAIAFATYNLGSEYQVSSGEHNAQTLAEVGREYANTIDLTPEGYGTDREFNDLVYIPENAIVSLRTQDIRWQHDGRDRSLPLDPRKIYMAPSGNRIRVEKHPAAPSWRLRGTMPEGVFCHKPCTVSGGGKSEISKSLRDYMLYGPVFVADIKSDLDAAQEIFDRDYSDRWPSDSKLRSVYEERDSRPILSSERSLGSVIKLLTPSSGYTDEFNAWLNAIPNHVYSIVLIIKRFYNPAWGPNWRDHFFVDIFNGSPGHELKHEDRKLVGTYLRVGLLGENTWRTFKCRQDFLSAEKLQTEDDISASTVVPARHLAGLAEGSAPSVKFAQNCEFRLFQRPDDAIYRGLDKRTEADIARGGVFLSNFEPLDAARIRAMTRQVADFDLFTEPMREFLRRAGQAEDGFAVCSANPRIVNGKPTKNPRYLQNRPDIESPIDRHAAEIGVRLFREIPANKPLHLPVNSVLVGRRNNPPDRASGIRGLAVYNPIHYQELPELLMDFIASLTGKSPSTTGFGSEGALTKGPFNALRPAADLNAAFVGYALTGLGGFSTAAGHIGPNVRMMHDISLLVPEIWCRMSAEERDPQFLISDGLLERLHDYEDEKGPVLASRLGYRINAAFVRRFLARVFDNPLKVFDDQVLRPEGQDPDAFADGVRYITEAHAITARLYFDDGSADAVCPPVKALLSIMAFGEHDGLSIDSPDFRRMFTREAVLASDWYRDRLDAARSQAVGRCERILKHVAATRSTDKTGEISARLDLPEREEFVRKEMEHKRSQDYLSLLHGTIGAQPFE